MTNEPAMTHAPAPRVPVTEAIHGCHGRLRPCGASPVYVTAASGRGTRQGLTIIAALALGLLLAAPQRTFAQASQLDPNMLIDTLAEEGMSDLLLHLIETNPPSDPVVAQQIEIAQHRLRYNDEALAAEARAHALEQALAATRKLIADFYDHEQRPIWQTDLAEMLLVDYLQATHNNATQFYEFGVPTAAQREAYETAVPEALEAVSDADLRFFQLRGLLPREPDHATKRVNTGLWARMIDEYYEKRTRYYLAWAGYLATLLPEEHPYFQSLGGATNPKMPEQAKNPEQERARLLDLAVSKLEPFVIDTADASGIHQQSLSLTGRAKAHQGQHAEAIDLLDRVIRNDAGTLVGLEASLGKAATLRMQNEFAAALDLLDRLRDHATAQANLLYRLLVVDAVHRTRMAQAEALPADQRQAAIANAYEPYLTLLNDPELGENAAGLQNYVYGRWEANLEPGQDVATLPAVVRLAIAQMARMEGQNLAIAAQQAEGGAVPQAAQAKLERAIEVSQTLTSPELSEQVLASAAFNRGVAQYWLDPQGVANRLEVVRVMTDLAEQWPGQPVAEDAIANAMALLRPMHQMNPRPAGVDEAYRRAAQVLFAAFPTSEAADNERLYYGFTVLQQGGRFAEAAEMYAGVPFNHPDYFEARRERLFALQQVFRQTQGEEQTAARDAVMRAAEQLRDEAAQAAQSGGDAEQQASAQRAVAGARLVLSDMAMAAGDVEQALALLEGFEQDFAGETMLIRDALQRRVVALVEAGRLEDASAEAARMMEAYADDAASVIDQVITRLENQIDALRTQIAEELVAERKQTLEQRRQQLAQTVSSLSQLLVDWAERQNYAADQMLPFQLVRAKALRLAGQARESVDYLQPLIERFGDDAGVLHEYAESLYAMGGEDALVRAAGYYDRLITGLGPPYPDIWWNAWTRRLQINDQLGEGTADIPLRVRQLRLTDPNLGGPRYRATLEQLEAKHAS